MPPVMGVAAFLMAEFLGKSYFEVVARGYVPALIYYVTVAVSVYLLATAPSRRAGSPALPEDHAGGTWSISRPSLP